MIIFCFWNGVQEGVEFLSGGNGPVKVSYDSFIAKHGHRCVKEVRGVLFRDDGSTTRCLN